MKTKTAGLIMLVLVLALGTTGLTLPAAAQAESAPEERLAAAEERLAEAAREIAEITSGVVPGAVEYARGVIASARRPVLGVSIGGGSVEGDGPVEGVEVLGVSPGSAAAEAGIRAGDVLTAIDGESLAAEDPPPPTAVCSRHWPNANPATPSISSSAGMARNACWG